MVGHRLMATGVIGEQVRRHVDLDGHPDDQRVDWFLDLGKRATGLAEQRQLHGETEPVGVTPPRQNQVVVRRGERELARQSFPVGGNAEQVPEFVLVQQTMSRHVIPLSSRRRTLRPAHDGRGL